MTGEIPSPVTFYEPIRVLPRTVEKLKGLLEQDDISDGQVLEAIADGFATIGRRNYLEAMARGEEDYPDWREQDEVFFRRSTGASVNLSYYTMSRGYEREVSFIQIGRGHPTVHFKRGRDGQVFVQEYRLGETTESEYRTDFEERKEIIGVILEGIESPTPNNP